MTDRPSRSLTRRPSGRCVARTVPRAALGEARREAMWSLFTRYYTDVAREAFDRDLDKKTAVILLVDSGNEALAGFSTVEVYAQSIGRRRFTSVFSGDTVLDEAYWGQTALKRAFFRFLVTTKLKHPTTPVYWFLISKGYKTYLLLARNVPTYYPRHDATTPAFEKSILDRLAVAKFGDAYDPETGVLTFDECAGRLRDGIAPIDTQLLEHDDIRFFVRQNPGHARGDELCCLGAVDAALPFFFLGRQATLALARGATTARRLWALATASF